MGRFSRVYFIFLLLALFGLSFVITLSFNKKHTINNTSVEIGVAPSLAKATINGHPAKIGKNSLESPGTYIIKASAAGFAGQTQTANVGSGQNVYVGFSLQPNSPSTRNWYNDHPADKSLSDSIGSRIADSSHSLAQQDNPFINQLPIIYGDGQGGIIRIYLGAPLSSQGPPAVYVTATTPGLRQSVLAYMRNRGYDPAVMDIVFNTQSNPLEIVNPESARQ